MAYLALPYYDVFNPVGPGCRNDKTDVQLVQYFLVSIYLDMTWTVGAIFNVDYVGAPGAIFPVSGSYSDELSVWIKLFQTSANQQGYGPLFADGKVNSASKLWGNKSLGGKWYTILAMNEILLRSNKPRFANLANDPTLPPELRGDLQAVSLFRR